MKCKSCQSELVIPEGRKSGYCVECGTGWTVPDESTGAVLDDGILDRIAEKVAERIRQSLQTRENVEDPAVLEGEDDPWMR